MLASLAPGLPPAEAVAADAEIERVHRKVMARLGIPTKGGAATAPVRAARPAEQVSDSRPFWAPAGPGTIRIGGRDPSTWTPEDREAAAIYRLGPVFAAAAARRGIKPPPSSGVFYTPNPGGQSPDHVIDADGTGHWEPPSGRVVMD